MLLERPAEQVRQLRIGRDLHHQLVLDEPESDQNPGITPDFSAPMMRVAQILFVMDCQWQTHIYYCGTWVCHNLLLPRPPALTRWIQDSAPLNNHGMCDGQMHTVPSKCTHQCLCADHD